MKVYYHENSMNASKNTKINKIESKFPLESLFFIIDRYPCK